MYKLYGRPGSGNVAVEALLAECGAAHEVITVERDAQNRLSDNYARINPMRQVPGLVLPDGTVMTESAAMMIYLADLHPAKGLAPAPTSPARASYLRWMVFMSASIYNTDLLYFYSDRYSTDPAHAPGIKAKAAQAMENQFAVLSAAIGAGPYVLGKNFSAADIYAAMLFTWVPDPAGLAARCPNLKTLHDLVAARPAIAPVWKRNNM